MEIPKFAYGQVVKVVRGTDETFEKRFLNRKGIIVDFDYWSGCGQSFPGDPMIMVQFPDQSSTCFWSEELELLSTIESSGFLTKWKAKLTYVRTSQPASKSSDF
jgi:hypothetical protein